jgi:hypothetical protein
MSFPMKDGDKAGNRADGCPRYYNTSPISSSAIRRMISSAASRFSTTTSSSPGSGTAIAPPGRITAYKNRGTEPATTGAVQI